MPRAKQHSELGNAALQPRTTSPTQPHGVPELDVEWAGGGGGSAGGQG